MTDVSPQHEFLKPKIGLTTHAWKAAFLAVAAITPTIAFLVWQ